MKIHIQTVTFAPDGDVEISYLDPTEDVKEHGVARMHTLIVPAGYEYNDEMEAVHDAAVYLVRDVMDDWDQLAPAELSPDDS